MLEATLGKKYEVFSLTNLNLITAYFCINFSFFCSDLIEAVQ